MQEYSIEAKNDFIEKVSQARPVQAISEIVWNSLDADATKINISFEQTLNAVSKIEIKDNGSGIPFDKVPEYFRNLGGSWKKLKRHSEKGRLLHGKEGKGRFKAKSLGRVCDWKTIYKSGEEYYQYTVSIIENTIRVSEQEPANIKKTGTTVIISELAKDFSKTFNDNFIQELTENFALYLKAYKGIDIFVGNEKIELENAIKTQTILSLPNIEDEELGEFPAKLEVIEWKGNLERKIYLCDKNGYPLSTVVGRKLPFGDFVFSAYLKSDYISELQNRGVLEMTDFSKPLNSAIDASITKLKELYRKKLASEAQTVVQKWKNENSYPYTTPPSSPVEEATRQVFDIIAVNVSSNIADFMDNNVKNRTFQLRLLKEVVEKSPEDLQDIISSVLDLPVQKRKELAELLKNTSLSSVISMAHKVIDRLNFINGIEELLFNDKYKKGLKERVQLQKLLEENTWFFGEEYNLVANDESLTTVLKKYAQQHKLNICLGEPVQSFRGKNQDIIDLMFSKTNKRSAADEVENLVIELKSPKQPTLTSTELGQIEGYATAVAADERFHGIKARWNFIVISNNMDKTAEFRANQENRPKGLISESGNIKIWAKTWSQFIFENKERHKFLNETIGADLTKSKSLEYLRNSYDDLLHDLIEQHPVDDG